MSEEEFDREAEKEKLRKQFEEEEEARRSTERMSELLLQGATMTNVHCEECGDPIFRDQGQEFCPTCERPVHLGDGDTADAASNVDDAERASSEDVPGGSVGIEAHSEPAGAATSGVGEGVSRSVQGTGGAVDGDVAVARAALVRTLTVLARKAEAAEDVGRARSFLQGAREAAEAIAAVDTIGR